MTNPSRHTTPGRARVIRAAAGLAAAAAFLSTAPAHGSADQNVDTDPSGTAHIAWKEPTGSGLQVHERTIAPDGSLGPAQSVSWAFRPAIYQAIGADDAGNAVIAWTSNDGSVHPAYIRERSAAGALSPPQLVSAAGLTAYEMELDVEPDGDAVVVWSRVLNGKQVIQARRRAADGTLAPTQTLSDTGADSFAPEVAVAPDGTAAVTWNRHSPDGEYVQTRTIAPDGALSPTQRLSATSPSVYALKITISDAGRSVVSWTRSLGGGAPALESRARSATGVLGAVQTIAPAAEFSGWAGMAGNGAGRIAYTWRKQLPDDTFVVMGRIRQVNGSLGPLFEVSEGNSIEPRTAMDPDGNATFVWKLDAATDAVKLRRRTPDGSMGAIRPVSDPVQDSSAPHVAVDHAGKATVVWLVVDRQGLHSSARTVAPEGGMSPIHRLGN